MEIACQAALKRLACYVIIREDHIWQEELEMATGAKILVVDDNDVFLIVVSKMLSRLGYEVSSADSAENGLSIFLENKFDVVLSDFEMPGMDGVAFACSVKKSAPRTRVVIMTGAGKEIVFSRKSTAVDEVISKPFTLAEIGETIQNLSGNALCA
jgi:two-component system, cell cycle sensor histidine kinase and response regulator CckA